MTLNQKSSGSTPDGTTEITRVLAAEVKILFLFA
jgi:hypothetical protein